MTASRLVEILGFYGSKRFTESWDTVKIGIPEKDMLRKIDIKNYEDHTLQYFTTKSKATIEKCGFFIHPSNSSLVVALMQMACRTYYWNKSKSFELRRPITIFRTVPQLLFTNPTANGMYRCIFLYIALLPSRNWIKEFFLLQKDNVLVDYIMDDIIWYIMVDLLIFILIRFISGKSVMFEWISTGIFRWKIICA